MGFNIEVERASDLKDGNIGFKGTLTHRMVLNENPKIKVYRLPG